MKRILTTTTLALALGLAGTNSALAASQSDAAAAIAAAEAAFDRAHSVGGAWRDTSKMIKKAQALLKAGRLDEALALANEAAVQGKLGYVQAMEQTSVDDLHI